MIPNREDARENTRKMKSDYATVASHLGPLAWKIETIFLPIEIWDSLALDAPRSGAFSDGDFLSGRWLTRDYLRVAMIGYAIGLPLAAYSFYHSYLYSPNLETSLRRMELVPIEWVRLIYPFQRIFLVMAHVSAIILLYKSNYLKTLFRCLEAVGQMAAHQLHHAVGHLHAFLLRLWIELLCRTGVLSNLLRCHRDLGCAVDRQPDLAAVFLLRPARVAVAEFDVLEAAAILAAGIAALSARG